jgi:hypothetical protein
VASCHEERSLNTQLLLPDEDEVEEEFNLVASRPPGTDENQPSRPQAFSESTDVLGGISVSVKGEKRREQFESGGSRDVPSSEILAIEQEPRSARPGCANKLQADGHSGELRATPRRSRVRDHTIEEAALAASSLIALTGAGYEEAAAALRAMADRASSRRRARGVA